MSSMSNNETLLESKEGLIDFPNEEQGVADFTKQHLQSLKKLKSFEILTSSLKIFTSNTKFTILVLLSIIPLLFFMVFFELKLQKSLIYASSYSHFQHQVITFYIGNSTSNTQEKNETLYHGKFSKHMNYYNDSKVNKRNDFLSDTLQLFLFYFCVYPILEFLSMILTMKITAKIHGADKQMSLKEMLDQKVNFKGPFVTYLCVHVLSTMNLLGLFWVVTNYQIMTGKIFCNGYCYYFDESRSLLNSVIIAIHIGMFLGFLYKYLDWSSFWYLGMDIAVIEEKFGIEALGLSDYYGKHCRKTGFQLMLVIFMFGNVPRVLSLFAVFSFGNVSGVVINFVVLMFFSLGNLVKWVAFVLYYFYCKQQSMEKKVDDQELGQTVSGVV